MSNKNTENEIFKDIIPLNFNTENNDIATQVQKLEEIVENKFGKRTEKDNKKIIVVKNYLSSTQLRTLYDKIKQCRKVADAQMLYPKIVYMAARQNDNRGKNIVMEIAGFIKGIESEEQLKSFKKFMEAIVAFHKYYYPSEN